MEDVFRPGTPWWEDANIWDPEKPWSSVHAAADVVARVTAEPSLGAILTPRGGITWRRLTPYLGLGKFYAVQGWRRNETGHTFLLEIGPTRLDEGRVIQSSEALGLRLDEQNRPIDDFLLQFQKGLGLVELW